MKANEIQHGGTHYKKGGELQHWDIISRNRIGYLEGCASKYVSRWRDKAGMLDLNKAEHYVMKIMEEARERGYRPSGVAPHSEIWEFKTANNLTEHEYVFVRYMLTWSRVEEFEDALFFLDRLKEEAKRLGL